MDKAKHTSGPWVVGLEDEPMAGIEGIEINAEDGTKNIAYAMSFNDDFTNCGEVRANAALIAAAPDLLDALISIEEYWNQDQNEQAMANACWHAINTARTAIAKAIAAN